MTIMDEVPRGRVAVIGQGHVGLPVALRAAQVGYDVVGFDADGAKVAGLRAGRSGIAEWDAPLGDALAAGRYRPAADPREIGVVDAAVVAVPTPLTDGRPDLAAVRAAAQLAGRCCRPDGLAVLESTVAPGTTRGIFAAELRAAARGSGGSPPQLVAFSPERFDPGNLTWRLENTPKLVGGLDEASTRAAAAFYRDLCDEVIEVASAEIAEAAKLWENTYRYVNIALVNEFAIHARALGIDVQQVIEAAGTKPFGFHAFRPGPGVGGHCLPIDPLYLSDAAAGAGRRFELVELAARINAAQPSYIVERAAEALSGRGRPLDGARILILGAAYKPGSADLREAPAIAIIDELVARGAQVAVADPHVAPESLHRLGIAVAPAAEVIARSAEADLVLLVTDHPEFPYERIGAVATLILDTRAAFARGPSVTSL